MLHISTLTGYSKPAPDFRVLHTWIGVVFAILYVNELQFFSDVLSTAYILQTVIYVLLVLHWKYL